MKKFALALMAAGAAVFGAGIVASAQTYSPGASVPVTPSPGGAYSVVYLNCVVGETITFSQAQSTPATVTAPCVGVSTPALTGSILGLVLPQQAANGNAIGNFTAAPTVPGTYSGTGSGQNGTITFSLTIGGVATPRTAVPTAAAPTAAAPTAAAPTAAAPTAAAPGAAPGALGSQLPATGASGIDSTTTVAVGLLVVGVGLLAVADWRRKHTAAT